MTDWDLGKVIGDDGADAPSIESIEKTGSVGLVDTYTITLSDGSSYDFEVTNGEDGSTVEVTQVLSSGTKIATITVDGTSTDLFSPSGGSADIVTSWEQVLSDLKVPSEKLTKETIDTKISKSQTAGLVKNDGTIDTTTYQGQLISGTNIKTVNNESLLGSGDLTISGVDIGTFSDLQDLIDDTSDGNTIILDKDYKYDPSTDGGRENGTYIDKDITIIGNGHIIDGNNNSRAFYIEDYIVNLYDLRIQNCNSNGDAGAIFIYSGATVYISKVQFINNNATNYGNGGAIYVDNATVNINNTTFTQNTADHYGGAICTSYATVTMINSSFRDNTATNFFDSIYSSNEITVYDCIIPDISTSCYNVSNITTESLYDSIEGLEEDMLL